LFFLLGPAASTKAQALYYGPFQHENFSILKWYPAGYSMGAYTGLYSYANLFDQNGISRTRLINAINNITTLYSNGKTTITISSIDNQPIFIRFQK
jgi:hypothetical protein